MSSIDERVVELQFNNQQFEQGVQTSMGTIERLKQSLNFGGAAKSFSGISSAASKSFSLSGITDSLEVVTNRFSAFGIIGDQVLRSLTTAALNFGQKFVSAVPRQIIEGGKNRALNIEQAKFQLEGLKVEWDKIKEDIDYAVNGTAYGMDAAAKVASQLVASNVTIGDNMKGALRGISGVAAMTNSSYEDIGRIFTTVAGNGRLMTMQLNQLSGKGLNVAATLGEQLGHTEAEIREMVTKGQIDFQTFANAMDEAFGTHATKANETFTGAMSNIKASLSRMGQKFATPTFDALKNVFNELLPVMKQIEKLIQPLADMFSDFVSSAEASTKGLLREVGAILGVDWAKIDKEREEAKKKEAEEAGDVSSANTTLAETSEKAAGAVSKETDAMNELASATSSGLAPETQLGQALSNISDQASSAKDNLLGMLGVQKETSKEADSTASSYESLEALAKEVASGKYGSGEDRRKALEDLGYSYEVVQNKVNELLGSSKRYEVTAEDEEKTLAMFNKTLEETAETTEEAVQAGENVDKIKKITDGLSASLNIVKEAGMAIYNNFLKPVATWAGPKIFDGLLTIFASLGDSMVKLNTNLSGSKFFDNTFASAADTIKNIFGEIAHFGRIASNLDGVKELVANVKEFVGVIKAIAGAGIDKISGWISNFASSAKETNAIKWEGLYKLVNGLAKGFAGIAKVVTNAVKGLKSFVVIVRSLPGVKALGESLKNVFESLKSLGKLSFSKITDFFHNLGKSSDGINVTQWHGLYKTINNIARSLANLINGTFPYRDVLSSMFDGVKESLSSLPSLLEKAKDGFLSLFSSKTNSAESLGAPIASVQKMMGPLLEAKKGGKIDLFGWITDSLKTAVSSIPSALSSLSKGFSNFFKNLASTFGGKTFDRLTALLTLGISSRIVYNIKGLVNSLKGITILGSVKNVLGSVSGYLYQMQNKLKADMLKQIAVSIGILVGALVVLSLIKPEKMAQGLLGITALFAELLIATKLMGKIMKDMDAKAFGIMAASMIAFGVAIGIMAGAVKKLGKLDVPSLEKGLIAVGVLAAIMVVVSKTMSTNSEGAMKAAASLVIFGIAIKTMVGAVAALGKMDVGALQGGLLGVGLLAAIMVIVSETMSKDSKGTIKAAASLVIFAVAIRAMAGAVIALGGMDTAALQQGLIAVTLLSAVMGIVTLMLSNSSGTMASAASLVVFAVAVQAMSGAVNALGQMDTAALQQGLIAVTLLSAVMGIVTVMLSNSNGTLAASASLVIFAVAIDMMAGVVNSLGSMDSSAMQQGLIAITLLAAIMGIFSVIESKISLSGAAALIIVSAALVIMSGALAKLASLSLGQVASGLILLGGALFELLVAVIAMKGCLAGAAALVVAAVALAILAPVLKVLGSMSLGEIGKALLSLAGVFIILGVAGVVLGSIAPLIMAMAGAVALIGAAALMAGAGISLFAIGLGLLVDTVGNSMEVIVDAIGQALEAIIDNITLITKALTAFGSALIEAIKTLVPQLVDCGFVIIVSILQGINDNIEVIVVLAALIIAKFVRGIIESIDLIIDAGVALVLAFIDGVANGIREHGDDILKTLSNLISSVIEFILTALAELLSGIPVIGDQLSEALYGARDAVKEHMAPDAGEEDGGGYLEGLTKSIEEKEGMVEEALDGVFEKADEAMDGKSAEMSFDIDTSGAEKIAQESGEKIDETLAKAIDAGKTREEMSALGIDTSTYLSDSMQEGLAEQSPIIKEALAKYGLEYGDGLTEVMTSSGEEAAESFGEAIEDSPTTVKADVDIDTSEAESKATESGKTIAEKAMSGITDNLGGVKEAGSTLTQMFTEGTAEGSPFLTEAMSSLGIDAGTSLTDGLGSILTDSSGMEGIMGTLGENAESLLTENMASAGEEASGAFEEALKGQQAEMDIELTTNTSSAEKTAEESANSIWSAFTETMQGHQDEAEDVGGFLSEGLATGISNGVGRAREEMEALGIQAIDSLKSAAGVNSPSTITMDVGSDIDEGLAIGVKNNTSPVSAACMLLVLKAINTLKSGIAMVKPVGGDFARGFISGISSKNQSAASAGGDLGWKARNGLKGIASQSAGYVIGRDLGLGMINGVNSRQNDAYKAGKNLRQKFVDGYKDGPSLPRDDPEDHNYRDPLSFFNGIYNIIDEVYDAGKELNIAVVDTLRSPMSTLQKLLNDEIDTSITIHPVFDLSDIQNGVKMMNGVMSSSTVNVGRLNSIGSNNNVSNADVVAAIKALGESIPTGGDTYVIDGITYDDGSYVADAVRTLVRAAKVQRRA